MQLKLYLLEQSVNQEYDTYDSIVVIAENEDRARNMTPYEDRFLDSEDYKNTWSGSWVSYKDADKIKVTYLGDAKPGSTESIVITSFNAG
jgi:hypothetical protein